MDYFEQQIRDIVKPILAQQIDFSIYPPGTADDIAGKLAHALRNESIVQSTGIGGRTEYQESAR